MLCLFEINHRIVDIEYLKSIKKASDFDEQGDVEGFFCLNFDGNMYNFCHYNPLREGETGWELMTTWFTSMLNALVILKDSNYAAVSDIENHNWIELKLEEDDLTASIIRAENLSNITFDLAYVWSTPITEITDYEYGEWHNIVVSFKEFKREITLKAQQYLSEAFAINPVLVDSKYFKAVGELIIQVSE